VINESYLIVNELESTSRNGEVTDAGDLPDGYEYTPSYEEFTSWVDYEKQLRIQEVEDEYDSYRKRREEYIANL